MPHAARWGAFSCGDARLDARLPSEVRAAAPGLRVLYEIRGDGQLDALFTLRLGVMRADFGVLAALSLDEPLVVPTLHVPIIAVRPGAQGQGRQIMDYVVPRARALDTEAALKTVSLDSTPQSDAFYTALGFAGSAEAWPDGTRGRWLEL